MTKPKIKPTELNPSLPNTGNNPTEPEWPEHKIITFNLTLSKIVQLNNDLNPIDPDLNLIRPGAYLTRINQTIK